MKYLLLTLILLGFIYIFVIQSIVKTFKQKPKFEDEPAPDNLNNLDTIIKSVSTSQMPSEDKSSQQTEQQTSEQTNETKTAEQQSENHQPKQRKLLKKDRKNTYLYNAVKSKTILDRNPNNDLF